MEFVPWRINQSLAQHMPEGPKFSFKKWKDIWQKSAAAAEKTGKKSEQLKVHYQKFKKDHGHEPYKSEPIPVQKQKPKQMAKALLRNFISNEWKLAMLTEEKLSILEEKHTAQNNQINVTTKPVFSDENFRGQRT